MKKLFLLLFLCLSFSCGDDIEAPNVADFSGIPSEIEFRYGIISDGKDFSGAYTSVDIFGVMHPITLRSVHDVSEYEETPNLWFCEYSLDFPDLSAYPAPSLVNLYNIVDLFDPHPGLMYESVAKFVSDTTVQAYLREDFPLYTGSKYTERGLIYSGYSQDGKTTEDGSIYISRLRSGAVFVWCSGSVNIKGTILSSIGNGPESFDLHFQRGYNVYFSHINRDTGVKWNDHIKGDLNYSWGAVGPMRPL